MLAFNFCFPEFPTFPNIFLRNCSFLIGSHCSLIQSQRSLWTMEPTAQGLIRLMKFWLFWWLPMVVRPLESWSLVGPFNKKHLGRLQHPGCSAAALPTQGAAGGALVPIPVWAGFRHRPDLTMSHHHGVRVSSVQGPWHFEVYENVSVSFEWRIQMSLVRIWPRLHWPVC